MGACRGGTSWRGGECCGRLAGERDHERVDGPDGVAHAGRCHAAQASPRTTVFAPASSPSIRLVAEPDASSEAAEEQQQGVAIVREREGRDVAPDAPDVHDGWSGCGFVDHPADLSRVHLGPVVLGRGAGRFSRMAISCCFTYISTGQFFQSFVVVVHSFSSERTGELFSVLEDNLISVVCCWVGRAPFVCREGQPFVRHREELGVGHGGAEQLRLTSSSDRDQQ